MPQPPNDLIGRDRIWEPEELEELQTALVGVISVTMAKSEPTPRPHAAPSHRSAGHSGTMNKNL